MKKVFCLILCTMLALFAAASAETFTFITPTDNEPASLNQLKGWTGDFFNNMYLLQAGLFGLYHLNVIQGVYAFFVGA